MLSKATSCKEIEEKVPANHIKSFFYKVNFDNVLFILAFLETKNKFFSCNNGDNVINNIPTLSETWLGMVNEVVHFLAKFSS